jgi:hypothetical protein
LDLTVSQRLTALVSGKPLTANFWLDKLNTFGGNFRNAEMVKAFLVSGEYRGRFPR